MRVTGLGNGMLPIRHKSKVLMSMLLTMWVINYVERDIVQWKSIANCPFVQSPSPMWRDRLWWNGPRWWLRCQRNSPPKSHAGRLMQMKQSSSKRTLSVDVDPCVSICTRMWVRWFSQSTCRFCASLCAIHTFWKSPYLCKHVYAFESVYMHMQCGWISVSKCVRSWLCACLFGSSDLARVVTCRFKSFTPMCCLAQIYTVAGHCQPHYSRCMQVYGSIPHRTCARTGGVFKRALAQRQGVLFDWEFYCACSFCVGMGERYRLC